MKILITGHKGYIGSALVNKFQNHEVVGMDWAASATAEMFKMPFVI